MMNRKCGVRNVISAFRIFVCRAYITLLFTYDREIMGKPVREIARLRGSFMNLLLFVILACSWDVPASSRLK
jgi:hypothetical protein